VVFSVGFRSGSAVLTPAAKASLSAAAARIGAEAAAHDKAVADWLAAYTATLVTYFKVENAETDAKAASDAASMAGNYRSIWVNPLVETVTGHGDGAATAGPRLAHARGKAVALALIAQSEPGRTLTVNLNDAPAGAPSGGAGQVTVDANWTD
jgi:hypothetical protein